MAGIVKRTSAELGEDTCLLGFSGRSYKKSAAFQASSLDPGQGGVNESQSVTVNGAPTGGTFTLTFRNAVTAAIPYNAAVSAVEDALEAIGPIGDGDVRVTGSTGGPYQVIFVNDLGHQALPMITATAALTGGTAPSVSVARTTAGSDVGFDPRILVGSTSFPGTIVTKVTGADGGTRDKVREYTGTGTIFGIVDGIEEFILNSPAGDRDVTVHQSYCVFDASKIRNYSTYKAAFDAWAAANFCKVVNG